ncbi:MAG: ATP-binding protein [Pseudomonadota bacterium]
MKRQSIRLRINVLISFFCIIFAAICLHLYFDARADSAEQVLKRIYELEKDFSAITISEEATLNSLTGMDAIGSRYLAVEKSCTGCHDGAGQIFSTRYTMVKDFYDIRRAYQKKLADVRNTLVDLVDSVSYIHEHHIAYLKNFLTAPGPEKTGDRSPGLFRPSRDIAPEAEIIRVAVQVQNSLVNILKSFNDLQIQGPRNEIRTGFESRFEVFRTAVTAFDDFSLDAQDGILVEELLLQGKNFNTSFNELLEVDRQRGARQQQLDLNRSEILGTFNAVARTLEKKNHDLRHRTNLFKSFILLAGMLLLMWIIIDGTRIINEIRRTVDETQRLREDLSYTITMDKSSFWEFQVVHQAMNSMAGTINAHVAELERSRDRLEKRVVDRTQDLVKTNQELQNEISERLRAEKELLSSRERLSLALDVSGGLVWEWNQKTGVLHLDDAVVSALGFSPERGPIGIRDLEAIHDPGQFNQIRRQSAALIKGKIPLYTNEHRLLDLDGDWRIFRVYGKVFKRDAEGRTESLLGTAIDITDQKHMEEKSRTLEKRLQQSQKMEAIGTLAGGIAHDFNNILGGILGYTQLAKRAVPEGDKASSYLDQILSASNRAKDLIQQILTFSRKSNSEKEICSLEHVVTEAMKLLRASIPANIEIRQNIEPGQDSILANPTQMHQVVMNLCTNAYQAMEKDGGILEVSLASGRKGNAEGDDTDLRIPSRHMKLTVADTGCGMDADTMTRIFDPYFTTKKSGEGIGMGLATVHGIIKEHGGHITVDSIPGRGATFTVFIPSMEKTMQPSPLTADELPFGTETILVVDDEPILTNVIKASLEDLGYSVVSVTDSREALVLFKEKPGDFAIAIVDYIMPGMKGDQLAREILAVRRDLPVILCTGLRNPLTDEEIAGIGIREIIPKPVDINVMALKVRQILNQG